MELSDNLKPVEALVGTWEGTGVGVYSTITTFEYREEITFTNIGKPFLHYIQRTWNTEGAPMHTETGYLRVPGNGTIEFILALPTGQTELLEGTIEDTGAGFHMELTGKVQNSSTAKHIDATERTFTLDADHLRSTMGMAAVGVPMENHLTAEYTRKDS
ncbi:MAG: FABP family protein [Trueperella sp.]|nr:FABP family protein [Trueperella sp.]